VSAGAWARSLAPSSELRWSLLEHPDGTLTALVEHIGQGWSQPVWRCPHIHPTYARALECLAGELCSALEALLEP
jgi:hypothetical protein